MQLALPPTVSIAEVAQLRDQLGRALEEGDLELDASAVVEIDAAGLQLLESAHRTALAKQRALRFVSGSRARLEPAAAALGLRLAADRARWKEGPRG